MPVLCFISCLFQLYNFTKLTLKFMNQSMNPSECLLSCVTCPLDKWTSIAILSNNSVFISNKSVSYSNSLDKLNKCNSET